MNLRQHEDHHGTPRKQPWYHQPETAPAQASSPQTRFEQPVAERILARAGALQEAHHRSLSGEQIEAIAAEIGIRPEFVHRAIEQETAGVLTASPAQATVKSYVSLPNRGTAIVSVTGVVMEGLIVTPILMAAWRNHHTEIIPYFVFLYPALLAFAVGLACGRRGWGAAAGMALALTAILAAAFSAGAFTGNVSISDQDLGIFALMLGGGALLGTAGAQVKRLAHRKRNRGLSHGV